MKNHGKIPYRLFWTWDHSTNWCMNTPGEQICGVGNGYVKNPEMFEKGYMRAVDYCAEHRINAIGIAVLFDFMRLFAILIRAENRLYRCNISVNQLMIVLNDHGGNEPC